MPGTEHLIYSIGHCAQILYAVGISALETVGICMKTVIMKMRQDGVGRNAYTHCGREETVRAICILPPVHDLYSIAGYGQKLRVACVSYLACRIYVLDA